MASKRSQLLAVIELTEHLDFYVESVLVHTCNRRDTALNLMKLAGWDQLELLLRWTNEGAQGAEHA